MKKTAIVFVAVFLSLYIPATLWAAQKTITTYAADKNIGVSRSSAAPGGSDPPPVNPPADFPPVVSNPDNPAIVVDPVTGAIVLGSGMNDGSGTVWYSGTSPAGTCNPCTNGVCWFGLGFRAYFEFKYVTPDASADSRAVADGFTFTIINAGNNDISKRGGVPTTAFSLGELMGFAGPGNTAATSSLPRALPPLDGLGLEPPKMAIEFDTYPNTGAISYNGCSGGRNDNNNNNHVSLLFWGANPAATARCSLLSTAGNTYPRASFDDNVHGAGEGTTSHPYNSAYDGNGSGLGGYYERARSAYNWMEDGQYHRVRMEVLRTAASQTYQVKTWVDCESLAAPYAACPASEYIYFQDVYSPYNNSSYLPKINRTQQLNPTLNSLFEQIIFGFTEGTGGSTQNISISNFVIYFPAYSISPAGESFTAGANTGTINVTAATATCAWTAVSNNPSWLTITGGASGTGDGVVSYSLAANAGAARTGTINVSGQLFTVTQAGCTYTVGTPSNLSFASGGGSGTVSVTASAGCPWTTSNNGNAWITITPAGGSGTGTAQTVNYTVAAGTGSPRTGTMTIAGQTFTVTQAGCTLTIADNSFACKPSTASNRIYIKVFLTDGAGGPVTDATVTYSVSGGGGSGTLNNNGGGWYGGTRTSNCGLGGNCARTGNLSGSRTVTVTATRAGCVGSPLIKTMTVP